jgi:hypothetical protein
MKESCGCKPETKQETRGFVISGVKKHCCEEKIAELSNSNTLSIDKSSANDFIVNAGSLSSCNLSTLYDEDAVLYETTFPDKIPKDGIPVTFSSLLI